jgi:cytochrome P450
MSARVLPSKLDALDAAVLDDPYPTYAALRAEGRVCRVGPASWGITRHADVAALLRDPRLGNEFPTDNPQFSMNGGTASQAFRRIIPVRNTDDHSRLHRLMVAAFSPGVARRSAERIRERVDRCLAESRDTGRLDAVSDVAFPIAAGVVCDLMGLPAGMADEIWPRAGALGKAFTPFLPEPDRAEADDALTWLRGYVSDLLRQRHRQPTDDLISRMLAAGDGDAESDEEIVDNIAFLCFTGFETTMNMVSTGCLELSRRPDEWARLRADRSLAATAVEEFVRFDAPIQYTARVALEPIQVGDRLIRAGRSVFLLLGSANHDERVFTDPGRIDVGRTPNPHVGFGGGVRGCLGAALARVEGRVIFDALAGSLAEIAPAGPPVRAPNALFRCYSSVPLGVRAA